MNAVDRCPCIIACLQVLEAEGFVVDMLEWVAQRAGFTYTLHAPTGNGSHCKASAGVTSLDQYAGQYNCGQDDVTELGLTDVYWGAFTRLFPARVHRTCIFDDHLPQVLSRGLWQI